MSHGLVVGPCPTHPSLRSVDISLLFATSLGEADCSSVGDAISDGELKLVREDICRQLLNSLSEDGFLHISCKGLSKVADPVVDCCRKFFTQNLEDKMKACSIDRARRGYSPLLTDNFASLLIEDGDEGNKPNDTVEKYRLGPNPPSEVKDSKDSAYFNCKEGKLNFFPNTWPEMCGDGDAFKPLLSHFYVVMRRVTLLILSLLNEVLELPQGFFSERMDKDTSILSVNFFPHLPPSGSTLSSSSSSIDSMSQHRIAEHTDVSLITVVYQTGEGLQVYDVTKGGWFAIPRTEDTFVVNVGDCLQDWSRGLLRSTKHRVCLPVGRTDNERLSIAFFASPNYDTELLWPITSTSQASLGGGHQELMLS